jgi:aryl-alcohol dehydrogenase-like predicted oxidoreductase
MHTSTFGKTGYQVSQLGFGGAPAAFLKTDGEAAARLVNFLLDSGVNLLDTAAMYPGSEEFIGNHFAHRRGEYVLVSKCGHKVAGCAAEPWTPELIRFSVDRALRLLKTDRLDVMLLHSCDLATLEKGEALGVLVEAREAGKIRFAGYSGDNEAAAHAATLEDIAVIETSVNIVDQANIEKVLPVAMENNVGVIVKRPVANACWKDLASQPGMYKNYAKVYTERFAAMGLTAGELGYASDADWAEIALRFTLAQAGVNTAIIGTTKLENATANLAVAAKGPLGADAVAKIRAAFARADAQGTWTGQT